MPVRPILLHGPSFLSTVLKTFGQLARIFWANGLPPLLAKNCPYAYEANTFLASNVRPTSNSKSQKIIGCFI